MRLNQTPTTRDFWFSLAMAPVITMALVVLGLFLFRFALLIESPGAAVFAVSVLGYACELVLWLPLYLMVIRSRVRLQDFIAMGFLAGGVVAVAYGTITGAGNSAGNAKLVVPFGSLLGAVIWGCCASMADGRDASARHRSRRR